MLKSVTVATYTCISVGQIYQRSSKSHLKIEKKNEILIATAVYNFMSDKLKD